MTNVFCSKIENLKEVLVAKINEQSQKIDQMMQTFTNIDAKVSSLLEEKEKIGNEKKVSKELAVSWLHLVILPGLNFPQFN